MSGDPMEWQCFNQYLSLAVVKERCKHTGLCASLN